MKLQRFHGSDHRTDVVVIGAGQAGLSCSHYLAREGIEHVLLERGEVANSWRRERWDSLRLLTPNWQSNLPGWKYQGADPDGFMAAAEVADFIAGYATRLGAPVSLDTAVSAVRSAGQGYRVETSQGVWRCRSVIVASGAFNLPRVPAVARAMPSSIAQINAQQYRNPGQLAEGGVLVVGAAATGMQIAQEIQASGRQVTLAVGEHVRMPRSYRGRDIQYWMHVTGLLDEDYRSVDDLRRVRRLPSPQLVGTPQRLELDLNTLAASGVQLAGRLAGLSDGRAQFSGALANLTRMADLKMGRLLDTVDSWIECKGLNGLYEEPRRPPRTELGPSPLDMDLRSGAVKTVLWATGYNPDYSWLKMPVLDRRGHPLHDGGIAPQPGLYFMGLPFMRRRKSSFLWGAEDDARAICGHLAGYLAGERARAFCGLAEAV